MSEEEKKELEGIRYIKEKNDMNDRKTVLALYNKLSEQALFHTRPGKEFMEEMKRELLASPEIDNCEIFGWTDWKISERKADQAYINEYRYKYYNSLMINIILAAALVLGYLITANSKNVNVINYENRLVDKYIAWEEQLEERESIVTEREKKAGQP